MKKENKNKKINNRERDQFTLVLEDINSKLDLVVDGHQALDKKIDKNHGEFLDFREEINDKFEMIIDELRLIRNDLKTKVGRDEFFTLEHRVSRLEKLIRT